jgi:hypothetical protein
VSGFRLSSKMKGKKVFFGKVKILEMSAVSYVNIHRIFDVLFKEKRKPDGSFTITVSECDQMNALKRWKCLVSAFLSCIVIFILMLYVPRCIKFRSSFFFYFQYTLLHCNTHTSLPGVVQVSFLLLCVCCHTK